MMRPSSAPARASRGVFALVASVAALVTSCSGARSSSSVATTAGPTAAASARHEIDFTEQPSYIPNDTLVLTFDDGPVQPFTGQVLDILKSRGVRATFFITLNTGENDVTRRPEEQALVQRIVREGHGLANHTVHHLSLKTLEPAQIDTEITGVERAVESILGEPSRRLTLLRAPFGEPYQDYFYDAKDPAGAAYPMVSEVVARHGVHVGWNVETDDWRCTTGAPEANADCVYDHFTTAVKTIGAPGAQWGIVLMHCVNPQTVAALPRILDYVRANRFKLASVEDVVQMRFGTTSASLVQR
jgi:peptidoglycan/xylan/chitin deacetylase (PgdA/CDA1 family)